MNSDIRVQISFSRHVKRKKLQSRLKADGVLALIDLWLYAGENHPDGVLRGMSPEDISLSANWNGDPELLISTLMEIGFIDQSEGVYILHDWEENNPYAVHAPERKERAQKAARARWGITDKCKEHANSMPVASLSNAPSPTPTPTPTPTPIKNKTYVGKFLIPTLDDITSYCRERKNNVDPEAWMAHYSSNGWMVGKNKMKDWKSAIITWEKRGGNGGGKSGSGYRGGESKAIGAAGRAQSDGRPYPIDAEY